MQACGNGVGHHDGAHRLFSATHARFQRRGYVRQSLGAGNGHVSQKTNDELRRDAQLRFSALSCCYETVDNSQVLNPTLRMRLCLATQ